MTRSKEVEEEREEKIRKEKADGRRKREVKPNMAACVLCIPVADGEASS